jgi:hypothetical protein
VKDVERKLCFMRCFEECLNAFTKTRVLPKSICYEPTQIVYNLDYDAYITDDMNICLFEEPIDHLKTYETKQDELKKLDKFVLSWKSVAKIVTNSEIEINSLGYWIQITSSTVIRWLEKSN